MFYCRTGIEQSTSRRKILWVCDNDGMISVSLSDLSSYDNEYGNEMGGETISSLFDIQNALPKMGMIWDEPTWDVYGSNLEYEGSIESLG